MSEHEQPPSQPPAEEPDGEAAERRAQAEDPISPVRGFEDLDEAEAQAEEAEESREG